MSLPTVMAAITCATPHGSEGVGVGGGGATPARPASVRALAHAETSPGGRITMPAHHKAGITPCRQPTTGLPPPPPPLPLTFFTASFIVSRSLAASSARSSEISPVAGGAGRTGGWVHSALRRPNDSPLPPVPRPHPSWRRRSTWSLGPCPSWRCGPPCTCRRPTPSAGPPGSPPRWTAWWTWWSCQRTGGGRAWRTQRRKREPGGRRAWRHAPHVATVTCGAQAAGANARAGRGPRTRQRREAPPPARLEAWRWRQRATIANVGPTRGPERPLAGCAPGGGASHAPGPPARRPPHARSPRATRGSAPGPHRASRSPGAFATRVTPRSNRPAVGCQSPQAARLGCSLG
jgi:hypothetical protein